MEHWTGLQKLDMLINQGGMIRKRAWLQPKAIVQSCLTWGPALAPWSYSLHHSVAWRLLFKKSLRSWIWLLCLPFYASRLWRPSQNLAQKDLTNPIGLANTIPHPSFLTQRQLNETLVSLQFLRVVVNKWLHLYFSPEPEEEILCIPQTSQFFMPLWGKEFKGWGNKPRS